MRPMSPRACRQSPSRARSSSPRMSSDRSRGFLSPKTQHARTQGRVSACRALPHRSRQRRRPKGGANANAACRARGGTRPANAPLGARARGRRPTRAGRRRTRPRQVAAYRGVPFAVGETPHTWIEWSASQLLQNTPLHPIAEWGRQRFGADAPAEQRLADLENTLRLIGLDPAEHAPLLAPLVDIPLPPDRATNFPPEELRRKQLAAMTAWVLAGRGRSQ